MRREQDSRHTLEVFLQTHANLPKGRVEGIQKNFLTMARHVLASGGETVTEQKVENYIIEAADERVRRIRAEGERYGENAARSGVPLKQFRENTYAVIALARTILRRRALKRTRRFS